MKDIGGEARPLKVIEVSSARYELLLDIPVLNMYLCKVDACAK